MFWSNEIDINDVSSDMAGVINGESLARGFLGGLLSIPGDIAYLTYDFLDTGERYEKGYDKERLIRLIANGLLSEASVTKIIETVLNRFFFSLNEEQKKNLFNYLAGKTTGRMLITYAMFETIVRSFTQKTALKAAMRLGIASILSLGGQIARAVYSSRDLYRRNSSLYWQLREQGDLDMLYFLVEEYLRPFEDAMVLQGTEPEKFDLLFNNFLGKLE